MSDKFRKKPVVVHALNFDGLVAYALARPDTNVVDGIRDVAPSRGLEMCIRDRGKVWGAAVCVT